MKAAERTIPDAIRSAVGWLTRSGVGAVGPAGAIAGLYDADNRAYDFIYHEVCGYQISAFVSLAADVDDGDSLGFARRTADYLLTRLASRSDSGCAINHGYPLTGGAWPSRFYTFDNGMICVGLLRLSAVTAENRYLEAAVAIGRWLCTMQNDDGSFRAYEDADSGCSVHRGEAFDEDEGALHLKLLLPLNELAQVTNEPRYRQAAQRLTGWGRSLADADGGFWANRSRREVFTHAHCYAVEGLAYDGFVNDCASSTRMALDGIRWLREHQQADGSLAPRYKHRGSLIETVVPGKRVRAVTDATAQAVRLCILLDALTGAEACGDAIERGVRFVVAMQNEGPDREACGGFHYGLRRGGFASRRDPRLSSWATQFAVQALQWASCSRRCASDLVRQLF